MYLRSFPCLRGGRFSFGRPHSFQAFDAVVRPFQTAIGELDRHDAVIASVPAKIDNDGMWLVTNAASKLAGGHFGLLNNVVETKAYSD